MWIQRFYVIFLTSIICGCSNLMNTIKLITNEQNASIIKKPLSLMRSNLISIHFMHYKLFCILSQCEGVVNEKNGITQKCRFISYITSKTEFLIYIPFSIASLIFLTFSNEPDILNNPSQSSPFCSRYTKLFSKNKGTLLGAFFFTSAILPPKIGISHQLVQ